LKKKGFFITFEGPEGSGKSTQIRMLADALTRQGLPCLTTREPGGTDFAERLRALIKNYQGPEIIHPETELLLIEAARSQHAAEKILPALEEGKVVLCDRFTDSSSAYQGVARGLGLPKVAALNAFATRGRLPDVTILLDLPPERGFARTRKREETQGEYDRFEVEDLTFHHLVRQAFLDLAAAEPERFLVTDADRDAETIHRELLSRLTARADFQRFQGGED